MSSVKITKVDYNGWKDCLEMSNGLIDLVATTCVGPRIIRFGLVGQKNEFCEIEEHSGKTGGDSWNIYGGHRLWHSPEAKPRTYYPDNFPIEWDIKEDRIYLNQPVEPTTGIKKDIEIHMSQDKPQVTVLHKLTNKGLWPVELSVWALSVMASGGKGIIPQPCRETGLLPNRLVVLWPYSKMNDERVFWGEKYITVNQDPNAQQPFKLGIPNEHGWAAYYNQGHLFVKKFRHDSKEKYPDFGCSWETYTNNRMMEMESLSPLKVLEPEEFIIHEEKWYLLDNIDCPQNEKDIDKIVENIINVL